MQMNKNYISKNTQKEGGQVIIGALLLFLTISITVLVGIATPVAIQVRSAADFLQSKQSYISADVLNEEALYRLNKGKTLPSSIVLSFNDSTSTALISTVGSEMQVLATGVSGLFTRMSQSLFTQGQGSFSLSYGMQVGAGGLTMAGSPTVNGNLISNGDIAGSGVSTINGEVTSAAVVPQTVDASNGTVFPPGANATFGLKSGPQDFSQSFTVSTTTPLSRVALYVLKSGSPASATAYITSDAGGNPSSATPLATGTLNATQVTNTLSWVPITFTSKVSLTPGTTYWIVLDLSKTSANYYQVGIDTSTPSSGTVRLGTYKGSWSLWSASYPYASSFFQVYLGGASTISGVVINGNANGYVVNNSTVSGTLYCQSGTGNNKSCNTASSSPNAVTYPYSDTNITNWKTEAISGGVYNGNLTINGVMSTTTGPLEINGNLTVTASGRMTMKGTIYVTGTVTVDGSGVLSLDSSYGSKSGVLVTDGVVNIGSSGVLNGSGTTGSYITVVTSNACGGTSATCTSPAVNLNGNAAAVVVFAPNGKISFSGSAQAKSLIAYKLDLSGNVVVNYDSAMASMSYDNNSGGGTSSWITDTWREISN
jgi:cytoskeletal protein CcmA (bactofilin family)